MKGKDMKRFLSLALSVIIVMTSVNIPVKAEDTMPVTEGTNVIYSEDFDDGEFTPSEGAVYGYGYDESATAPYKVEDGALVIDTANKKGEEALSGGKGTRIKLTEIDTTTYPQFSASMDVTIQEFKMGSDDSYDSSGPGLIFMDNGQSGANKYCDDNTNGHLFSMIWLRMKGEGTTGAYTYGLKTKTDAVSKDIKGFCIQGDTYTIKIKVDTTDTDGNNAKFMIVNKSKNLAIYERDFLYGQGETEGSKPIIGLFSSMCKASYDNIVVYSDYSAYAYEDGQILYKEDFTDFDATSVEPYGYMGVSTRAKYTEVTSRDGKFVMNTKQATMDETKTPESVGGIQGTRIKLYDIPDEVDKFSVSVDVTLKEFEQQYDASVKTYTKGYGGSGPALLIADNGGNTYSNSTTIFSMIWMRKYNSNTSGAYSYGSSGIVAKNNQTRSNICDAGDSYTVKLKVEGTTGTFKITNNTDQQSYEDSFTYDPNSSVERMIGLYSNACDAEFDNLYVRYGDAAYDDTQFPPDILQYEVVADVKTLDTDGSTELTNVVGGTVEGTGEYTKGSSITLTAIPASGYHFVKWLDANGADITDAEQAYNFAVQADVSYTAVFQKDGAYEEGQLLYDMNAPYADIYEERYGYAYNMGWYWPNEMGFENKTYEMNTVRYSNMGGRYGTRAKIFDIPEQATNFSAEVDVTLHSWAANGDEKTSIGSSNAIGLIVSDNGVTDTGLLKTESKFDLIWLRPDTATSGARLGYGSDKGQSEFANNLEGLGKSGRYTIKVYVQGTDSSAGANAIYEIINQDTKQSFRKSFKYTPGTGMERIIGLYSTGANVSFSDLKVYNGNGVGLSLDNVSASTGDQLEGYVLYDFNEDYDEATSSEPYGYSYAHGDCVDHGLQADGSYRLNTTRSNGEGGRYGTRVKLFDIPEGVEKFSAEVDLTLYGYLKNKKGDTTISSVGAALLFADNMKTDEALGETDTNSYTSAFSMLWLRSYGNGGGDTCAYRYTDSAYMGANYETVDGESSIIWNEDIGVTGNYTLQIYVDTTGVAGGSIYRVVNKDNNKVYTKTFTYTSASDTAEMMIGFYSNGANVSFKNLMVYNGDGVGLTTSVSTYEEGQELFNLATENVSILSEAHGAGADATVSNIENGEVRITATSKELGGRNGSRYKLFDIPADAERFSAEVDLQIHGFNDDTNGAGPGLIIADDGASSSMKDKGLNYSMIWLRRTGAAYSWGKSGAYTYSDFKPADVDKADNSVKDICREGDIYTIKVYVDGTEGKFQIYNKSTGSAYTGTFLYNPLGVERNIGFYVNACDVTFSGLKVYYGDKVFNESDYTVGQLLYTQDFADFDETTLNTLGCEKAQPSMSVENEALRVTVSGKYPGTSDELGGRNGARIKLFELPLGVEEFSAEMDVRVHDYNYDVANGKAGSLGLVLADDLNTKYNAANFNMIWLRQKSKGTAGGYSYYTSKDCLWTSPDGVVDTSADEHPCVFDEDHEYTVKLHVKGGKGTVEIINNTTGKSWKTPEGKEFSYNPMGVDRVIGIYANGVDASFDNLNVYYGDALDIADSRKTFELSVWDDTTQTYVTQMYTNSLGDPYVKSITSKVMAEATGNKVRITLQKDYSVNAGEILKNLTVSGKEVVLNLNGYTLTQNGNEPIFTSEYGTLNVQNGTLKLTDGVLVKTNGSISMNLADCIIDLTNITGKITVFGAPNATISMTGGNLQATTYENIKIGNVAFPQKATKLTGLVAGGLIPTEIFKDENGVEVHFAKTNYDVNATEATLIDASSVTLAVWSWDKTNSAGSVLPMPEAGVDPTTGKKLLTAPIQSAYTFVGWYVPVKDGEAVSGYSELIQEDVALAISTSTEAVAVYVAQDGEVTLTLQVPDGVTYTVKDANGKQFTGSADKYTVPTGSKVTIETTTDNFLNWQNASDKIISTSKAFTCTVGVDTTVHLTTRDSEGASIFVRWISKYNQVLMAQHVKATGSVTYPVSPSYAEGKFTGWTVSASELNTKITELLSSGQSALDVEAIYEDYTETYTVTVYANDEMTETLSGIQKGTSVTVTAPAVSGKSFSHWSDAASEGKTLSTTETYYFIVNGNVTLYAIYSDDVTDKIPVINMTDIYYIDEYDGTEADGEEPSVHKIAFEATRSIPEGYNVLETGMLYSVVEQTDEETFVIGSENVNKFIAKSTTNDGVFTLYVNATGHETDVLWARGYVVVQDAKGNIKTIYDEMISSSSYYEQHSYRVLLTSDVHATTLAQEDYAGNAVNNYYGISVDERMNLWVDSIVEQHQEAPLDLLIVAGDISLDYWTDNDDMEQNPNNPHAKSVFADKYLAELKKALPGVDVVILPGNHDLHSNSDWKTWFGNERQCYYELGNNLFIMPDSYSTEGSQDTNPDGTYTGMNSQITFINGLLNQEKYQNYNVYIVSHNIGMEENDTELVSLVKSDSRIKGLFAGHTHKYGSYQYSDTGKRLYKTGNFQGASIPFNYTEEEFKERVDASPWGYRDLVITPEKAVTNYIAVGCYEEDGTTPKTLSFTYKPDVNDSTISYTYEFQLKDDILVTEEIYSSK